MINPITNLTKSNKVADLFKDHQSAARAYQAALNKGYKAEDINLLMTEETRDKYFPNTEQTETALGDKSLEGAAVGSAIGGALGAIAAAIMATGTVLAFPGLGLAVSGPLAASLAGGSVGSFTGWFTGAFVGSGIPDERIALYEDAIKKGGIIIAVTPSSEEDAKTIENEWKQYQGEPILAAA